MKRIIHPITLLQVVAVLLSFSIGTSVCGFKKVRHTYHEFAKYFPQCRSDDFEFHKSQLMLKTHVHHESQLLFVIRNVGSKTVYLDHAGTGKGVEAGWSTHIRPHHVTAFAMDRDKFELQCKVKDRKYFSKKKTLVPVNCQDYFAICTIPSADFLASAKGTYWVAENFENPKRFAQRLHKRGIYW